MKVIDMPTINDGLFIDYFLNRSSSKDFLATFEAPQSAIKTYNLTNLFNLLKYAFFNNTTNSAGAHHILLKTKCIVANIELMPYGAQRISIADVLPDYNIVSFHCNPISPKNGNIVPVIINSPEAPTTSVTIFPARLTANATASVNFELLIFAASNERKNNLIYSLLNDAFTYCQSNNYRYAIIAAHNAYELAAKHYMLRFSKQCCLNEESLKFISHIDRENISTISSKYLPLITSLNKSPVPPKVITDNIVKLNKQRNLLTHALKAEIQIDKNELYDFMLATFFICKYFELNIPHQKYSNKSFASEHHLQNTDDSNITLSIWK